MERWNCRCQMCGRSIGDYRYIDEYWFVCAARTGLTKDVKPFADTVLDTLTLEKLKVLPFHKVEGSWGRLGYTLCIRCGTKAHEKCPTCRLPLIKVHADQHPGGHWGIHGEYDRIFVIQQEHIHKNLRNYNMLVKLRGGTIIDLPIPKREPAEMW